MDAETWAAAVELGPIPVVAHILKGNSKRGG